VPLLKRRCPVLTDEQLNEIRARKKDPMQFHNVRIAQTDREVLLKHINYLNQLLEDAEAERLRIQRSLE